MRGDEPTAGLPPSVAEKVFRVREIAEDRHRKMPELEERQAANQARGEAQRRLDRLLGHPHESFGGSGSGFGLRQDDVRVVQQRRVLQEATMMAERLAARYEAASAEWQPAARTRHAIDTMLRNRRHGTTFAEYVAEPRLAKGEDILGACDRLARRCRELRADAHRVESAPFPLSHARTRLVEAIDRLAKAPNVSALIEHEAGDIWWPRTTVQSQVFNVDGRPIAFAETPDALGLLAWTLRDTLIKQMDGLLAEESDDANALSLADRQKQGLQIQSDLAAVEYDLAAMVWRGLDDRLPVWFDGDQSAMTVIGAQLVTQLATNGGSSPEHAGYEILGPGRR